jgi:hypothetical protein
MATFNRHAVEVGVLAGIGNLLIFQHFMPPVTDVKSAEPFDILSESSEREALIASVVFTAAVAGAVRSWDTFLIAGAVLVGVDFAYKHANAVHPVTGKMSGPAPMQLDDGATETHPLPDYASTDDSYAEAG